MNFWEAVTPEGLEVCIGFSKTRLRRLIGFFTGICLLRKNSRNLGLIEAASYRFFGLGEEELS